MQKIAFAVGDRDLEEYLQGKLKNEFTFVGATVFREGVIRLVGQTNPDIVILRESLEGRENILSVIYELQVRYPNVRIVFLAGKRDAGDGFLTTLVSYGIYDILHGQEIHVPDIIRLIREPNKRSDVMYLQPKPVLDETGRRVLFEAPDVHAPSKTIVKEVIKEVFIDSDITDEEIRIKAATQKSSVNTDEIEKVTNVQKEKTSYIESEVYEDIDEPIGVEKKDKKGFKIPQIIKKDKKEESKSVPFKVQKETSEEDAQPSSSKGFFSKLKGGVFEYEQKRVNQMIITFAGIKSGVGNTSIAFNTAIQLAKKGKVLYVEMNDRTPALPIWYELTRIDKGIETALDAIKEGKIERIKDIILPMKEVKKINSQLQSEHKKMPDDLDILTFSKKYTMRLPNEVAEPNYDVCRELYLYLLYQLDYNYIILDVPQDVFHPATYNAVMYSNKLFFTVNQDVATLAKATNDLHELEKQGLDIAKKLTILINRYNDNVIDMDGITEWLQITDAICLPEASKEFVYANYHGTPFSIYKKNGAWKSVWNTILKSIG